jgi:hypothetical protein
MTPSEYVRSQSVISVIFGQVVANQNITCSYMRHRPGLDLRCFYSAVALLEATLALI